MIQKFIEENKKYYQNFGKKLFETPELGYKEFETKKQIIRELTKINPNIEILDFGINGFMTKIGVQGLKIGIVAEIDAVYGPTHFMSNSKTGAAHSCGHYSQAAICVYMYKYFYQIKESLNNTLIFLFTPAEEFVDLEYRKSLLNSGKIKAVSGKINMILKGLVDSIDLFYGIHSTVNHQHNYQLGTNLVAFDYYRIIFRGKAAHAGFSFEKGINALESAVNTFQFLKKLEEEYGRKKVRLNPIIECDQVINIIPARAQVETYIRVIDTKILKEITQKIDAFLENERTNNNINYELEIIDGYLEFIQSDYLLNLVKNCFAQEEQINYKTVFSSGDIGDFSFLAPTIQIGYAGFKGNIYGDDFNEDNSDFIYGDNVANIIKSLLEIDQKVDSTKLYKRTRNEYYNYKFSGKKINGGI